MVEPRLWGNPVSLGKKNLGYKTFVLFGLLCFYLKGFWLKGVSNTLLPIFYKIIKYYDFLSYGHKFYNL